MREIKNVIGSSEQAKPVVIGKNKVYVHENIIKLEDSESLYRYDEIQYSHEEYIKILIETQKADSEQIDSLVSEINSTQLALCDIYEMLV